MFVSKVSFLVSPLARGSLVLFFGTLGVNILNYFYHLLMGRMLGPINYGLLTSLISLIYLLSIPLSTLGLTVVKYISALKSKNNLLKAALFYRWINKKTTFFLCLVLPLLLISSPFLTRFFHLDSAFLLWLIIASQLLGAYSIIALSALQGLLKFKLMVFSTLSPLFLKLIFSVFLVYLGWGIWGAAWPFFGAAVLGVLIARFMVGKILPLFFEKKAISYPTTEVFKYSLPVFFFNLAFTSLYSADIILARHFLAAEQAGYYASLATLGKIIFFASSPITMAMFPLVSAAKKEKEQKSIFRLSLFLVFLISLLISGIYFLFPKLVIGLLYGSKYLAVSHLLIYFALFLSFYALSNLIVSFYLSLKKTKIVIAPILAAGLQIFLIFLFHQNIFQIAVVSLLILVLLCAVLLGYSLKEYGL